MPWRGEKRSLYNCLYSYAAYSKQSPIVEQDMSLSLNLDDVYVLFAQDRNCVQER